MDDSGSSPPEGGLHHVELWVPDLRRATVSWGWLLDTLGWEPFQEWSGGWSRRRGDVYLVVEESPALTERRHDRLRPGLNHLAFHVGSAARLDELMARAPEYGWAPLFMDLYPHAGGEHQHAGYLEDADGFEAELVAPLPS